MANVIQNNEGEWVLREEWCFEDIRNVNNDWHEYNLSDEDCLNIMRIAETSFDANIGLNWDSISSAIDFYFNCIESNTPMFYRGEPIKVPE
jgi:hypothetical protein